MATRGSLCRPGPGVRDVSTGPGRGRPSAEDGGALVGQDQLAVALADFARTCSSSRTRPGTLIATVLTAVSDLVPGCRRGFDQRRDGAPAGEAREPPSGDLARDVDALQDEFGEGPCLDAVYEQQTVRVSQTWPPRRAGRGSPGGRWRPARPGCSRSSSTSTATTSAR